MLSYLKYFLLIIVINSLSHHLKSMLLSTINMVKNMFTDFQILYFMQLLNIKLDLYNKKSLIIMHKQRFQILRQSKELLFIFYSIKEIIWGKIRKQNI